jgi:hypothetical protein
MNVILTKTLGGLMPNNPDTQAWYDKIKVGESVHADFKKYRNPAFHRKYMALLNIGFDNWEPGEVSSKHGMPLKNFERFRKDIAIMCGHFHLVIRLDGTSRPEADSISFAKMDEGTFAYLYDKTIDILIKNIYGSDMTPDALNEIVNQYLQFA